MGHVDPGGRRGRLKRGAVIALAAVVSFIAGNVFAPLTARYVPLLGEELDESLGIDPLVVNARWPVVGGCDTATTVAMPKDGPGAQEIEYNLEEDPRVTAIKRGAASWNRGTLRISMRARDGVTVHINDITPVRLTEKANPAVDWVLGLERGCGGPGSGEIQPYLFNLDEGFLVSRDEQSELAAGERKSANFGGISIADNQSLDIMIDVTSCSAMHEWMVKVDYSAGSKNFVHKIGSESNPLRSVGGIAGVPIYGVEPGTVQPGRSVGSLNRKTSSSCKA